MLRVEQSCSVLLGGGGGGTGGLMVKIRALDPEQGLSPASVRAYFSFPLFNLNAFLKGYWFPTNTISGFA